ncbi:MAG: Endoglucanase the largest catalytic component of the cellulosome / Endoglucanase precursor [Labilithrix sp.]|nr:Endoglucanase the largest catalytic component of the cellulosome / Endoglucanase precursor [Labilithrix sp.]
MRSGAYDGRLGRRRGALACCAMLVAVGGSSCSSDPPRRGAPSASVAGPETDRDAGSKPTDDSDSRSPLPVADPDDFTTGEVDVVSAIRTDQDRRPISPLIYGINTVTAANPPPERVMAGVSFVRRGGDRANAYNWETNVSNGSFGNGFGNDMYLATGLANPGAPGALDLTIIGRNRAAGRGTMVPFVLNDWVAGPLGGNIPYDAPGGWTRSQYFHRVGLVKPTPFAATPDPNDGVVYTDEHFAFLRTQLGNDIYAPGPSQVMVGIDNEPDLYSFNFPMLQSGAGAPLFAPNGVQIGTRITGHEFTARFLLFAKRIKQLAPNANIVGPSHYHFDGWTSWHSSMAEYTNTSDGKWYMDDFLARVKTESAAVGARLLDTWDFHWYPQTLKRGVYVWDLDDSVRTLTPDEVEAIVQSPRSYWDHDFNEDSWITNDHLFGPTWILERLQKRIDAAYPGTHLGVSEYFPGGCAHISSGLGVADSLGIFQRMGVHLAAMWPTCNRLEYAFGALELLRNADGKQLRFADTVVRVEHPEKVESSVYAGSDSAKRVTMLVINKTGAPRRVGLRTWNAEKLDSVAVWRIDAAHPSPHLAAQDKLTKMNAYAYTAPPMSAAMLVFTAP